MQTPEFLSRQTVLEIHADQIEGFGGTSGVRDEGLLDSALAQPQATFSGQLLHPTISEQAAAYLYHLAMNHPVLDGNKRTAFAVMDTFLNVNGYRLDLSNEQAYKLMLNVAQGNLSKPDLISCLRANIH